jgi:hypothetical protein
MVLAVLSGPAYTSRVSSRWYRTWKKHYLKGLLYKIFSGLY